MDDFFRWLEATDLSVWTRESTSVFAFPAILSVHAIGMALAAGISGVLALRVLGVARDVPVGSLRSFVPPLWAGFVMNAVSGVLLLVAYPTKALTNPVFFVKMACIGGRDVVVWCDDAPTVAHGRQPASLARHRDACGLGRCDLRGPAARLHTPSCSR